jgi:hypothetical protein
MENIMKRPVKYFVYLDLINRYDLSHSLLTLLREKGTELDEVQSTKSNCVTVSSIPFKNYWDNYHI